MFGYLAANVVKEGTHNPLLPPYDIVNTAGGKIAFVGETFEDTPLVVTPSGVAGLDFLDEADTANALVPELKAQGVETIVLLLHQGGFQNAPFSRGFMDVNACENFSGPDLVDVVTRLNPEIDVVVSAHTHAPYVCQIGGRLVTSASSFGRLITSISMTLDRRTGEMVDAFAVNHVVTQTVAKDPATTALLAHYKTFADPISNRVVGSITGSLVAGRDGGDNAAGESTMGDVIADAQLEATKPSDFGGSVVAFMNPGGIRGERPVHAHGRSAPARHLRRAVHGSAVLEHARGQDLHGRADRRAPGAAVRRQPDAAGVGQPALQLQRDGGRRKQGRPGIDQDQRHDRQSDGALPRDDEQLPRRRWRRLQRLHAVHEPAGR